MLRHSSRLASAVVISGIVLLGGCRKEGGSDDVSPPGFVQVLVQLEAPSPPNPRGEFNITSSDVTKSNIGSSMVLRLIATAGDSESGISTITPINELRFRCAFGSSSETVGILETKTLDFSPAVTPAAPPVSPFQINVVADPMGMIGCSTGQPGHGPIDIEGFVRVSATNGAGLTTTSRTFVFDYVDVGSN
jgi:hypothetical protein